MATSSNSSTHPAWDPAIQSTTGGSRLKLTPGVFDRFRQCQVPYQNLWKNTSITSSTQDTILYWVISLTKPCIFLKYSQSNFTSSIIIKPQSKVGPVVVVRLQESADPVDVNMNDLENQNPWSIFSGLLTRQSGEFKEGWLLCCCRNICDTKTRLHSPTVSSRFGLWLSKNNTGLTRQHLLQFFDHNNNSSNNNIHFLALDGERHTLWRGKDAY